jgi:hypothetical protein
MPDKPEPPTPDEIVRIWAAATKPPAGVCLPRLPGLFTEPQIWFS